MKSDIDGINRYSLHADIGRRSLSCNGCPERGGDVSIRVDRFPRRPRRRGYRIPAENPRSYSRIFHPRLLTDATNGGSTMYSSHASPAQDSSIVSSSTR